MTVFLLQWLLHELHHIFTVAGFGSHCHWVDPKNPIPVGRPGHHYYAGKMICKLYGTYGRLQPQVPHG